MSRPHPLYTELAGIVGSEHVTDEDFACWATVGDISLEMPPESALVQPPTIVVRPQNVEQVSRILKLAQRTRTPVTVAGAKSGAGGANTPTQGGILLDMLDMDKVMEIDEDSMAVLAQAGCTWSKLRTALEKKGYRTGILGPHGCLSATLGGGVAYGIFGIDSAKYGMIGEQVASLEVVLPNGDTIRTGSRCNRNTKWLFRYINGPDATGIFIGSQGVFGIITEVALKIYPIPQYVEFCSYWFDSYEAGFVAMYKIQQTGYISDGIIALGRNTVQIMAHEAPEKALSVIAFTIESNDERIAKAQKDVCEGIALKENGKDLGPEVAKRAAYDKIGKMYRIEMSWGASTAWLGAIPTNEMIMHLEERIKEDIKPYEGMLIKSPRRPDLPAYTYSGIPMGQTIINDSIILVFDGANPLLRRKFYDADKEWFERSCNRGRGLYWIGMRCTSAIVNSYSPQYREFLRNVKRAVDPNMILNPGVLEL